MKTHLTALALLTAVALGTQVHAEEGGAGHYVPGSLATIIDQPPTAPGFVLLPTYLRYEGEASASATLPFAGLLALDIDATSDAVLLGGVYTLPQEILGAHYTLGAYLPYVWMDVTATLTTPIGAVRRTDSADGIGDMTLIPAMLAWESGPWQFSSLFSIYAPTGDYEVGRLANPGMNHWSYDPVVGISYNNEEIGFNAQAYAGYMINSENSDTNYESGDAFHVDASVQQLLPLGGGFVGIGANAFLYEQVSGDSGSGARLGDFEGRSYGVGPVLSYILPFGETTLVTEVRWLPELDTENRLEGDYIWLKFAVQF